jgi:hypothetical protein
VPAAGGLKSAVRHLPLDFGHGIAHRDRIQLFPGTMLRCIRAGLTLLIAGSRFAAAQVSTEVQATARAAGDSAVARHDWKALVSVYQPVTRAEPENGLAWLRLGAGLQELGKFSDAANAYRQCIRVKFQLGTCELRLARVLARSRMFDSVASHLEQAGVAGIPVELITTEPDLDPVRKDARYVALISRLEDARYPCRKKPEAHQFDFWVGDWAVTQWNGPGISLGRRAENHVQPDLAHCVIREHWTSPTGSKGESANFWDPNRRAWRQIWMDDSEWSLDYEGEYKDGAMRFHGWTLGPNGERRLEKLTFFDISPDTVRQLFEQSTDSGRTWHTTFDGRYVRMKQVRP